MSALVQLKNVSKTFPGVKALDGVNIEMNAGEVLALVGENGAGKSTLMKILSGTYPSGSFEGEIFVDGKARAFHSPLDAEAAGIAIIHQELSSFSHLSVAENLFVGHWPTKNGLIDWPALNEKAKVLLARVGARCLPETLMKDLSVGSQQMVEIAKALSRNSRVLILDEPTSALTPPEVETLFKLIRELKAQGHALVYISHKMEEIYNITDRIVVLRDGQTVHTDLTSRLPEDQLITYMVGRSLERLFPEPPVRTLGEVILKVDNFSGVTAKGEHSFGPISFSLRRGEILGFAGLLGAGRSELLQGIFGHESVKLSGSFEFKGQKISLRSPRQALRRQLAFVGEDRKRDSLLPTRSLDENASIARLASHSLLKFINGLKEFVQSKVSLDQLHTRATSPAQLIQELSGGNQQKVIIARALQTLPEVILMDEPTRGVDVGAKFEIYEILFNLAKTDKSFLLVSSDLPELIGLSDRIIVLNQGRQMATFERAEFSQTEIMKMAVAK